MANKFTLKNKIPPIPLIADDLANNIGYRDTLDRVVSVMQLLTELDLSRGLSPKAENGLYWIQLMLIDSLSYVSDELESNEQKNEVNANH